MSSQSPFKIAPVYVSRKQAAVILSCSDQMISKLIKNQELRAYYLGRAVRIKISELDAVMTTKAVDGRAQ